MTTSLCSRCGNGHKFTRTNGKAVQICNNGRAMEVPQDIVKCDQYQHFQEPALYDLEKIAWVVTPDKSDKAGFKIQPPKKQN